MLAVHRLVARAIAYLLSAAQVAGHARLEAVVDLDAPADPAWANYLQTEWGEPLRGGDDLFLETA
jgi:hypothetical protein